MTIAEIIKEKYPHFIPDYRYCGYGCGPGWNDLIEELLSSIDWHIKQQAERHAYWHKQITSGEVPPIWACPKLIEGFKIDQIKEKFGSLRFYSNGNTDEYIDGLIHMTEALSATTCEDCGNKGKIIPYGWYVCRCTKCNIEHKNNRFPTEYNI